MKCHNSRPQLSSDTKEKEQRNKKPQNSDMQEDDQQSDQLLFPYLEDHNTVYSNADINAIMKSYDSRKGYDLAMPGTLP